MIFFLRCVSISRYALHFLWLECIENRDLYRTTLYTLIQKTEFEVFAQEIATYFQGDLFPEEFTRTLFKKIYLNPNGDTLLYDMEPRTLRGYFYGEHNITTLAKKINKGLDAQYF